MTEHEKTTKNKRIRKRNHSRRSTSSSNTLKVMKRNRKKEAKINKILEDFELNCPHAIVYVRRREQDESAPYFTTDNNIIEQLEQEGKIKRLTHGLVIIIDWDLAVPVLIVQFNDVPLEEAQFLCAYFKDIQIHLREITGNTSQINGTMYATGHRTAMMSGFFGGIYSPATSTQVSVTKEEEFVSILDTQQRHARTIYEGRFMKIAPTICRGLVAFAKTKHVPSFAQLELDEEFDPFASNLTWTKNDFYNDLHMDGDANPYAYGIWMTTYNDTLITDAPVTGCEKGYFYVPQYRVFVDFGNNIVEIVWRGREDLHCTTPSKRRDGYQRIGTSIQISKRLVIALQKYYKGEQDSTYKGLRTTLKISKNKRK